MKYSKLILILILAFGAPSCAPGSPPSGGASPAMELPPQRFESIDFAVVKARVFESDCVSCHRQYGSYESVKFELGNILSAVEAGRMPRGGGPLSAEKQDLLRAWRDAGAPEVAGQEAPAPSPEIEPTWRSVYTRVLAPKCTACHRPGGQARFLDLSTSEAFQAARDRVFGDGIKLVNSERPDESYLLQVILDPEEPMPPKWSKISPLNEREVAGVRAWIAAGAKP
ncbi:MAG: hypothetical protein AB7P04_02645 [Bacteriovoracia bacterium]